MTNALQLIENQGGILSGKLSGIIAKNDRISLAAARKRVQRLSLRVHRLSGIFRDRQVFLYHSSKYNSEEYFLALREAIGDSALRCNVIIAAIDYHSGLILKQDLPNFSFSPILNRKGHMKFSTLVEKLVGMGVLREYDEDHYALNNFLATRVEPNFRHFKAIQLTNEILKFNEAIIKSFLTHC